MILFAKCARLPVPLFSHSTDHNSGVISRNSCVICWTEFSAGFDVEKFFKEEF